MVIFTSKKIGDTQIPNRFVHSATYEVMAKENGEVSDELIKRYIRLSKGGVGLIITGQMFVHPSGRGDKHQTGIHNDGMLRGLSELVDAVHQTGSKIAFQLVHCGRQATKEMAGQTPLAPSSRGFDPANFVKPKAMVETEIKSIIYAFAAAAERAVEAGADAIQLHGAHGYLISEFLSPYFNIRKDAWGGNDEKRFRFLKEIMLEVKRRVPKSFPVLIKLNANDYTPKKGTTPSLTARYTAWLKELGVDGVEISCGTSNYSFMNMCRGEVPTSEIVEGLPKWKRPLGRFMIKKMEGKFDLEEAYNLEAAKLIKPVLGDIPLFLVGGMRTVSHMENILSNGYADFISLSRPFIRESFLVKKIKEGKMKVVSCISCNRCFAAVANNFPVYCYQNKKPKKYSELENV